MITVRDIACAIETFAPKEIQESYDNSGLQVGNPESAVNGVLLCLDVTEDVLREARTRQCNMIVSHHPLLFSGLREITGRTATQRIVIEALRDGIAIYSAHTNLDSISDGVSHEMAHALGVRDITVLAPSESDPEIGLGVIGTVNPTPTLEFLRKVKETFSVKALRYSAQSSQLVVRKVAVCGGSGASMIKNAIRQGADIYITGDLKYHDFTSYGMDIVLADIGHYEGELCARKILSKVIRQSCPGLVVYFSESESNPIRIM